MSAEYGAVDVVGKFHISFVLRYAAPDGIIHAFFFVFPEVSRGRSAAFLSPHVDDRINEFRCGEQLIAQIRLQQLWRMSIMHCNNQFTTNTKEPCSYTRAHHSILSIRQSLFPALLSKQSKRLGASDELVIKTPILSCLQQMAFHTRIGRSLLTAEN